MNIKHINLNKILAHPFLCSVIYVTLTLCIVFVVGMPAWEGSDDYTTSHLLMGTSGEQTPYVLVINYYLAEFIVKMQQLIPTVNWLSILEIGSVWGAFVIVEWFLLKNSNRKTAILVLVFPLIFVFGFYITLQYTRTTFLYCFAGGLIIFDGIFNRPAKIVDGIYSRCILGGKILIGMLLFSIGVLFRNRCFYLVMLYIGLLVFNVLVFEKKGKEFKKRIKKYIIFLSVSLILFLVIFVSQKANSAAYEKFDQTNNYRKYNRIRSDVTDYLPSLYGEIFVNGELLISENDWLMLQYLIINDSYFNEHYLNTIYENLNGLKEQTDVSFQDYVNKILFYQNGKYKGQTSLAIVCCVFFFMGIVMLNKKNWIVIICDIAGTIILSAYFVLNGRYPSWVAEPIYLMSCVVILYALCHEFVDENRVLNIKLNFLITLMLLCVLGRMKVFAYEIKQYKYEYNLEKILTYAAGDKNNFYLLDNTINFIYPIIDTYGPFKGFEKGEWENIQRTGNWDIEHPVRNRQKEAYEIESAILSMATSDTKLISTKENNKLDIYKVFLKEHYGLDVKIEREMLEDFGDYAVYSIVKAE